MSDPPRVLARWLLALASLLLLALAGSCTVPDDVVENKRCVASGTDPNRQCLKGYECKCALGECLCKKAETAAQSSPLSVDPSRALLRRLGVEQL